MLLYAISSVSNCSQLFFKIWSLEQKKCFFERGGQLTWENLCQERKLIEGARALVLDETFFKKDLIQIPDGYLQRGCKKEGFFFVDRAGIVERELHDLVTELTGTEFENLDLKSK